MSQTTDAVIAELMDRRLLNDVDSDLHQEIAEAVIKAAQPEVKAEGGRGDLTPEQISIVNDMIIAWIDPEKLPQYREAFRNDCKRLLRTTHPASPPDAEAIRADERERCARIAEAEAARWHDGSSARVAAANIRMAGRLALEQNEKEW